MAFQAALAILVSELFTAYFELERGYWTTLTAMAVTTQTWAENIKKSYERLIMTVLGGLAGTLLYFIIPKDQTLIVTLLLIFVFFTVYLIQIYHLLGIFFLTCFVVFLFAIVADWNFYLLAARIYDTIIGIVIALIISAFFMPVKTNVNQLFVRYYEKIKKMLNIAFEHKDEFFLSSRQLIMEFHSIKKKAQAIQYELMLRKGNQNIFHTLLKNTAICTHEVIGLVESYQWISPHLSEAQKKEFYQAVKVTQRNIETLLLLLKKQKHSPLQPPADLNDYLQKSFFNHPESFTSLDDQTLGFFNLMYFIILLNKDLYQTYQALS